VKNIEVKVADLKNDPRNRRVHDEASIAALAESLRRFGQQKPIVATKDKVVIAGNGLLMAARSIGLDALQVAITDLPAKEVERFAITDNRTSDLSSWDFEGLLASLQELESDLPGASADWVAEIDAIVNGGKFAEVKPDEDAKDIPRSWATIKLSLANDDQFDEALDAVKALVASKPHWTGARVVGAKSRLEERAGE